jgi:hypothetical protein
MKITYMVCGHCISKESMMFKGASSNKVKIPVLVALIEHPVHGKILFDTGYSERFYKATSKWPATSATGRHTKTAFHFCTIFI